MPDAERKTISAAAVASVISAAARPDEAADEQGVNAWITPDRGVVIADQSRSYCKAHSTAKCNGEIFGAEENLTRSSVAEYLSGARVEFILDPLDIGMGHNREIGTLWEVLSE
jgi:hypothetical protein